MKPKLTVLAALGAALMLPAAAPLLADPAPATAAAPASKTAMSQAEFHDLVVKTYWIDPKKQKDEAYLKGGTERMDTFWQRVFADKAGYAPLLAAELQRDDLPPNFYLDGPMLLTLADDSPAMGQIAANALLKVDFKKIGLNPGNYVLTVNMLMASGIDTSNAALHMLDANVDEFMVNHPYHVFFYSKTEALVWGLFGMDEARFVPKLAARLQTETDDANLTAIIHALWESVTPEGWAALKAYANGPCKIKPACKYAREMMAHKGDEPPAKGLVADDLRKQRRKIANNPFSHNAYIRFHKLSDDLAAIDRPQV